MARANGKRPIPPPVTEQMKLARVQRWMTRGGRPTDVMRRIRKEWGCAESTAWGYIAKVRDQWAANAAHVKDPEAALEEILAQLHELLRAAWAAKELSEVRRVLALLADVKGLRRTGANPQGKGRSPEDSDETIEDIERELAELTGHAANASGGEGVPGEG